MKISVKSSADEAKIKELIETAEAHCPVVNTVKNPVKVKMSINYEKLE